MTCDYLSEENRRPHFVSEPRDATLECHRTVENAEILKKVLSPALDQRTYKDILRRFLTFYSQLVRILKKYQTGRLSVPMTWTGRLYREADERVQLLQQDPGIHDVEKSESSETGMCWKQFCHDMNVTALTRGERTTAIQSACRTFETLASIMKEQ